MRNIRMFGLFAISALALVVLVGASSASAAAKFTAANAGEALENVTQVKHVFTITGSELECEFINFNGATAGKEVTEQVVSPSAGGCTAFGFKATIDTNGCEIRLKAATTGEHATAGVEGCGSGTAEDKTKGIQKTVKIPFVAECILDIPEQSLEKAVHYTNTTAPNRIDVKITASGVMIDITKSTGLCPLSTSLATHTGANGATYTGETRISTANGIAWDAL